MKILNFSTTAILALLSAAIFSSCDSNSDVKSGGTTTVSVTDATIDDTNIIGVYLKVREIQVRSKNDIKVLASFDTARVFNVMDYTNGATFSLGEGELEAGTYSELRLILDESCYVKFEDGAEETLEIPSGSTTGYKIKGDFNINANSETDLVVDIDLRKAFVTSGNGEHTLRPTARLVKSENTASIDGTIAVSNEDRVVIYAYAKDTYTESEAGQPAAGSSRFENSINSGIVSNGQFNLSFLEPGEYDLVAAAYTYNETAGTYTFKSAKKTEFILNGSLLDFLDLEANVDLSVVMTISF